MTLLRTVFEAFLQGLRRGGGNRLTWVVAIIGLLIGCAAAVVMSFLPVADEVTGVDFYGSGGYLFGLQAGLPLLGCYLGAELIHGEIADRSGTHMLVRPVPRVAVMVGRWLAAALVAATVIGLQLTVTWSVLLGVAPDWRLGLAPGSDLLGALVLGAFAAAPAYAAVGLVAGAAFKRPVVWSLAFVVGWEFLASNLPPEAGVRMWTVADPLRRLVFEILQPESGSGLWAVLLSAAQRYDPELFGDPALGLARFTAIALAIALVVYSRREYDSRARD